MTRGVGVFCANSTPGIDFPVPTYKGTELISENICVAVIQSKLEGTITLARHGNYIFENFTHGLDAKAF